MMPTIEIRGTVRFDSPGGFHSVVGNAKGLRAPTKERVDKCMSNSVLCGLSSSEM